MEKWIERKEKGIKRKEEDLRKIRGWKERRKEKVYSYLEGKNAENDVEWRRRD